MPGHQKKYGRWDGDLQMYCQEPIQVGVAQPTDPPGTPLFQQGDATDDEYRRLMAGLAFLKFRAERGDVGPLSREEAAPTIKDVTEAKRIEAQPADRQTQGEVKTPPFKGPGWQLGPAHPDYGQGSMHQDVDPGFENWD